MKPSTETSPLLPKTLETKSESFVRRRARHKRNIPSPVHEDDASDNNDASDDDESSSDEELYQRTRGLRGVISKPSRRPAPLSYNSDSSATPLTSMGMLKRKPRWSGFRSRISSLPMAKPDSEDLVPRVKTRRNRFRSSDFDEALTSSRSLREPPTGVLKGRVAAYCTCDQIALFKLLKWLDKTVKENKTDSARFHLSGWKNKMYMGVVHSFFESPKDTEPQEESHAIQRKDAFYFATGCCVFWGLTREEEAFHIQALTAFSTGPVAEIQAEDMKFVFGDTSRVANDAIVLHSDKVEEKLAISFAMAQSAKLDVFEERVEDRIRNTKHIPFNLATTGSIQHSQTDISKLIGQLFIELADVNLHSDILDEPDFFWEDDEYEPLYKKMTKYLDVNNRVKILNKRLDILRELVEVLNQELTQQHGTKLEWIIIWLLVVGVLISVGWNMILKDILGFFNRK
ncbi:hypothetical protein Poli38472_014302 [Pythium oligandrum]|uniref:DUF155 domain-containing protein n=1 Tax=Pythium oligandrum TaxID=41045 RepID=A0A8K1C6V7_PYTOL|nr:hypothetical protein Poli38472_014302 [Pythium oligandrum]|eukprot:TMW57699.1 hypothetical protein Poli38472_014302 [Pythium oligandrum]